jgi:AraC family transcriptional regulator
MKKVASGRIAFWEGGSLWVLRSAGEGDLPHLTDMHEHHAFQLTFALNGQFRFHLADGILPGPFTIIAPDVPHAFESQGFLAILFVEPESRAGRTLLKLLGGAPAAALDADRVQDAPQLIGQAFADPDDPSAALRDVGLTICNRIAGHTRATEPDRRVRQMLRWASKNLDTPLTISAAAEDVGLSAGRASHLFVEETGLPFRTYVLWLRLVRAVDAYSTSQSLTHAAHAAGFADSAHLSRTFRRMFGLPAAALAIS